MKNPFQRSYSPEETQVFEFLSGVKLFRQLTSEEKSLFLPYLYLREYQKGEVVFFRGDPAHALYVVKKGEIDLVLDMDEEFEKLASVRARQSFGNNALIPNTNRLYSAIVQSNKAKLYVIPHVNISDVFREQSQVKAKMSSALAQIYEKHVENLYESYRSSKGFFSLEAMNRAL